MAETPKVGISRALVKASPAFGRRRLLKKHGLYCFCPASFLTFGRKVNCLGPWGRKEEGIGAKIDLFSGEAREFESKSVTDTRATTDKNDPFLNMGFKHGKKWVDKNGAKCNMRFGRITKNTRFRARSEPPLLRKRVEHAWRMRWWSILSCTAARALAASLVDSWGGVGADGGFPAAHEVEAEQAFAGLV